MDKLFITSLQSHLQNRPFKIQGIGSFKQNSMINIQLLNSGVKESYSLSLHKFSFNTYLEVSILPDNLFNELHYKFVLKQFNIPVKLISAYGRSEYNKNLHITMEEDVVFYDKFNAHNNVPRDKNLVQLYEEIILNELKKHLSIFIKSKIEEELRKNYHLIDFNSLNDNEISELLLEMFDINYVY